jgi:hypothetical protein
VHGACMPHRIMLCPWLAAIVYMPAVGAHRTTACDVQDRFEHNRRQMSYILVYAVVFCQGDECGDQPEAHILTPLMTASWRAGRPSRLATVAIFHRRPSMTPLFSCPCHPGFMIIDPFDPCRVHQTTDNSNRPPMFNYFAFGVGASEVELDVLTGSFRTLRADLLMDVGTSINPAIDIGQVNRPLVAMSQLC